MKKNTRFAFNAYLQQLARLNGVAVEELSSKFTVDPSVQQTLEDQIQQSAAFLTLINVTPVTEQSGQLLGLGVGSTIAGTTDTTAKEREPVDPTLMVDVEYKCEQTNFDTVLTYAKLDLWAKFQDFQVRIRDAIVKRQALDRIMIGFNGVKRAKTSNRSENPLLQDVNKGWLQKIREDAPDHVMGSTTTGGETTPGAVKVGKGGEYANLDAVVMDAVNELIDVVYQDDDDLVVICGRELLSDKYFPLVNKEQENSEKLAADMIISQKRMGGLQAVRAPFFPPNALLITRLDNTSGVIPGKTITERQAAEGLISNVLRVERALERCVKQQPPQKVYDAAVSFAFNVGTGNACSSTLVKLLNQRRWADACRQLPRWVYVKGVFNQGLDNRRAREMAWCLQGAN
ncbi:TPA: phage major capsid protein, P2 family [Escherichia coli]|nr:phage major capsid protein, P2 family [Escherichia coli]HBN1927375.1 phage major capsid protein, P2 family [Escherichia coli]HDI6102125.1 phage major capsid protein, P2 family [Escherichia coli]HDI6176966.1 phage major capsid protein, P2 family [Escherichia coli]